MFSYDPFGGNAIAVLRAGAAVIAGGAAVAVLYKLCREEELHVACAFRHITRTIKIPGVRTLNIFGRKGESIRDIERKTSTRMRFAEQESTEAARELTIRGKPENVYQAELLIHKILLQNQSHQETLVLRVPHYCVGSLIGRGGETVQSMQFQSKCKINVARGNPDPDNKKEVTLRGSSEQVAAARRLIEEIVDEVQRREDMKGLRTGLFTKDFTAGQAQGPDDFED